MNEILPLALGGLLGLLASVRPLRRLGRVTRGALLALVGVPLGVLATVVTGEFRLTWGFVFVDIPLVLLAAVATRLLIARGLRRVSPQPSAGPS